MIVETNKWIQIRDKYCSAFCKIECDRYKEAIVKRHEYSDGLCYNGYLWDYLCTPVQVEEHTLISKIQELKDIYVLWDIHSAERIFIEDYWKFGKDAVLLLDGNTLIEMLHILPEDIYIFDSSYTWTMILTHEYIEDKRYCLNMVNSSGRHY